MEDKERIKLLRKAKGLTQKELGERLDVSKQYISQLEQGAYKFNDKLKRRIIKEFGLPLNFFEREVRLQEDAIEVNKEGEIVLGAQAIKTINDFINKLNSCNGAVVNRPVSEYYAKLSDRGKLTIDDIIKTMYDREQAELQKARELKLVGEDDD